MLRVSLCCAMRRTAPFAFHDFLRFLFVIGKRSASVRHVNHVIYISRDTVRRLFLYEDLSTCPRCIFYDIPNFFFESLRRLLLSCFPSDVVGNSSVFLSWCLCFFLFFCIFLQCCCIILLRFLFLPFEVQSRWALCTRCTESSARFMPRLTIMPNFQN